MEAVKLNHIPRILGAGLFALAATFGVAPRVSAAPYGMDCPTTVKAYQSNARCLYQTTVANERVDFYSENTFIAVVNYRLQRTTYSGEILFTPKNAGTTRICVQSENLAYISCDTVTVVY